MKLRIILSLVASVFVGIAITLVSGAFQTPMGQLGIDVVYRGLPLFWTMQVIPTRIQSIDWINLAVDAVFWVIITSIIVTSAVYFKTKTSVNRPPSALDTRL
jgi:hypothetical protein